MIIVMPILSLLAWQYREGAYPHILLCLQSYGFMAAGRISTPEIALLLMIRICTSYINGNASAFPGSDLVQEANNEVIAVPIQYRMGLFGMVSYRLYIQSS